MEFLTELGAREVLGIPLWELGEALTLIVGAFVAARVVEFIIHQIAARTPEDTVRNAVVEALVAPSGWAIKLVGIWLAFRLIDYPPTITRHFDVAGQLDRLVLGLSTALGMWFGTRAADGLGRVFEKRAKQTEGTFDDQLVPIARTTAKIIIVSIGILMVAQNLGYSISSLIAGLGIGGAALALASKDTVANFFGAIVIFVDRPFQIGDWVEIGDVEGTVEEVDLRVTRIRTFANSLQIVPNSQFTVTAINNWSRMRKRRIKMSVGVTYDATPDQLEQAVEAIRELIRTDERLSQDFFLVNFHEFGASSLNIYVYLFTVTTNWAEYMQVRQEFLLKMMRKLGELGLEFAFPTQTIHLEGLNASEPPGAPPSMARDRPL